MTSSSDIKRSSCIHARTKKRFETMTEPLVQLGVQLIRFILPFIIAIGVLGNWLNIVILTRPALYCHACSRYFLALAGNNLIYANVFLINRLLASGYQINLANASLAACKIISYLGTLNAFLSPYLIAFASMDRFCASSVSARMRKFSSVQTTKWAVAALVAFYTLFFIHILVMTDLPAAKGSSCVVQANTLYSQVYILVQVFLFAIVPPALMIGFGLLTIRNSQRTRVLRVAASRFNRTERQLAQMLFLQVGVHILLTLPSSTTYLIAVLPNSIRTTTMFAFVGSICQILFNFSYTTAFFLYLLSGRIYRRELKRVIFTVLSIHRINRVQPSADQQTTGPASQTMR